MIIFRFPNINTLDLRAAVENMRSYLWQLAEQLNRELNTLETAIRESVKPTAEETFNSIKALVGSSKEVADGLRRRSASEISLPAQDDKTIDVDGEALLVLPAGGLWLIGKDYAITIKAFTDVTVSYQSDHILIENFTTGAKTFRLVKIS